MVGSQGYIVPAPLSTWAVLPMKSDDSCGQMQLITTGTLRSRAREGHLETFRGIGQPEIDIEEIHVPRCEAQQPD